MDETFDNYYLFGLEALQERLPALANEIEGVGAARDTDVQIARVQAFLTQVVDESERVGIERLLLRLRQQRARSQDRVLKALDRLTEKRTLDDMRETLQDLLVHARVYEAEALPADLYQRANEAIRLRLEELLACEPHVAHPERAAELHQMRIAAKHLRYTLEVFEPLYKRALRKPIKILKEIQDLLGEMHDCDVWQAYLPRFLEEERAYTQDYFGSPDPAEKFVPGLHALEDDRRQQRLQSYYIFRRFWELTQERGVWERIREVVATPSENQPDSPAPTA
jgi:CHAD domain-containing protein